ncbi:MAG: DNA polymerase III subunit beta [Spirochaetes bacterium]|nr:DNA polymerase III subunit beta [Spirochaetota bacterium]
MKFKCLKKDILKVIAVTEDVVEGKIVYNIESNVMFDLNENVLTLTATDNSVWVKGVLQLSEYSGKGTVGVFAKKIVSIIKEMPEGFLSIEIDKQNKIRIASENNKIKHTIIGIKPDDFPAFPDIKDTAKPVVIPAKEFVTMVNKCLSFTARDTFKPVLRGIYFEKEDNAVRAIATDGKRLAFIEREFEGVPKGGFGIIIEPKVLTEMISIASGEDAENVTMTVGAQQVSFGCGSFQFVSTLIEGKYPNYKQVVPKDFGNSFRVNKNDLMDAVRRVTPMIQDVRSKKLIMEVGEGSLNVKGVNQELGESSEEIEVNYQGDPCQISFNYTYIQDIMRQIDADIITFRFNDDTSPAMVKEIERNDYFYIVMPMKAEEEA